MAGQSNNDNVDAVQAHVRARMKKALDGIWPMIPDAPKGQAPPMVGSVAASIDRCSVTINMTFIIGGGRSESDEDQPPA